MFFEVGVPVANGATTLYRRPRTRSKSCWWHPGTGSRSSFRGTNGVRRRPLLQLPARRLHAACHWLGFPSVFNAVEPTLSLPTVFRLLGIARDDYLRGKFIMPPQASLNRFCDSLLSQVGSSLFALKPCMSRAELLIVGVGMLAPRCSRRPRNRPRQAVRRPGSAVGVLRLGLNSVAIVKLVDQNGPRRG